MASKIDVWNMALDKIGESAALQSEADNRASARVLALNWDRVVRELLEVWPWAWARRQRPILTVDEQEQTTEGDDVIAAIDIPFQFLESDQVVVYFDDGGGEEELTPVDDYTLTLAEDGANASIEFTGWTLATGETIRIVVTTERQGWEHVYALPSDCVTPIALVEEDTRFDLLPVDGRIEFEIVANDGGDGMLLCCDLDEDDFEVLEYTAFIEYVAMWPAAFVDAVAWRLAAELALSQKKDKVLQRSIMMKPDGDFQMALDQAVVNDGNLGHTTGPVSPTLAARGASASSSRRGL